jgi:plasmid stabilization system protein ParE
MAKLIRHFLLETDIVEALRTSLQDFGGRQSERYAQAIEDTFEHLRTFPNAGQVYEPEPRYRVVPISRRGLRARHWFLYAVEDDGTVLVLRLLHDRMEVVRHIPQH